jgi:hypothetical protein
LIEGLLNSLILMFVHKRGGWTAKNRRHGPSICLHIIFNNLSRHAEKPAS